MVESTTTKMINLGLQRISRLLRPLFEAYPVALPWKAVHVAGTNGKGSVAALISTALSQRYKVGRFTSPHLVDRWDCITLNQQVVPQDLFLKVERQIRRRNDECQVGASEFELLTATAFELFTQTQMDVAVVECGLGGRLDATNVLRPRDVLVSVLTKVGLDHVEFLGDTVAKVAAEKAGIFKPGVGVVVDQSNPPQVLEVVDARLKELGLTPFRLPERYHPQTQVEGMPLATHQRQNLVTAFAAYSLAEQSLCTKSWEQNVDAAYDRLPELVRAAQASLPGRLQWLDLPDHLLPSAQNSPSHQPRVPHRILIDGAHNPQSAEALAEYVDRHVRTDNSAGAVTWVLAAKNDKDVGSMLSVLVRPSDNVATCSFGSVDGMPWVKSMDASQLAEVVRLCHDHVTTTGVVEVGPNGGDIAAAIKRAVSLAETTKTPICIAGSLYLVGDVLRLVRDGGRKVDGVVS